MDKVIVEFDGAGHAENDLARLWTDARPGERQRITDAEIGAEDRLKKDPKIGSLITDGVLPPVRYLDCDVLRIFYQYYESESKIIIIGFRSLP